MSRKAVIGILVIALIGIAIIFTVYNFFVLEKAHSSFDNYYNFRGCSKLIDIQPLSGICQLKNGQKIQIVQCENNKWYLANDTWPWKRCG